MPVPFPRRAQGATVIDEDWRAALQFDNCRREKGLRPQPESYRCNIMRMN